MGYDVGLEFDAGVKQSTNALGDVPPGALKVAPNW
jgi:hypothetical protein